MYGPPAGPKRTRSVSPLATTWFSTRVAGRSGSSGASLALATAVGVGLARGVGAACGLLTGWLSATVMLLPLVVAGAATLLATTATGLLAARATAGAATGTATAVIGLLVGVLAAGLLTTLATTGAIYLFKPQLDRWEERAFSGLPTDQRVSPNAQLQAVMAANPDAQFHGYRLPEKAYRLILGEKRNTGARTAWRRKLRLRTRN